MNQEDFHDWYVELGVAPDASSDDIKRAWRRHAQRSHPDRETGSAIAFMQAKSAFEVLSNPQKRIEFDERRRLRLLNTQNQSRLFSEGAGFSFRHWWQDIRDNRRDMSPLPQADRASVLLRVPLAQIFLNTRHRVSLRVARTCHICQGMSLRCQMCGGTGQRLVQGAWDVDVPAGTPDGAILRLAGQGHQGPRFGSAGDILITVAWTRRGIWRWTGERLVGYVRVSRDDLIDGASLRIRAADGNWGWFTLPEGDGHSNDQSRVVRLYGQGLPDRHGVRADAFVECFHKNSSSKTH